MTTVLTQFQLNALSGAANAIAAAAVVTPVIVSNRNNALTGSNPNEGVAPFCVQFHACDTTDTGSTNTFRDCAFIWNFGDGTVGAWGGSCADPTRSRNLSYGPVAGHTYETPGTYKVTLTVYSASRILQRSVTTTITVLDPSVVYAGTKTICFANGTDFTGAPAGCVQVASTTTLTAALLATYVADGIRLLFKRGDTFHIANQSDNLTFGTKKGCTAGAWGSGAVPIISFDVQINSFNGAIGGGHDCRFMDMKVVGRGNVSTGSITGTVMTITAVGAGAAIAVGDQIYGTGITGSPTIASLGTGTGGNGTYNISTSQSVGSIAIQTGNQSCRGYLVQGTSGTTYDLETKGYCTILRVEFQQVAAALVVSGTSQAVQDCKFSNMLGQIGVWPGIGNSGNPGIWSIADGMKWFYCAGNYFDRANTGEHGGRFQGLFYAKFECNYWAAANQTKYLLTCRGMPGASAALQVPSANIVIDNEYFDPSSAVILCAGGFQASPQNLPNYEPLENVLLQHCYFGPYSLSADFNSYTDCVIQVRAGCTIRHNVMNHSSPDSPTTGKAVHTGVLVYGQQSTSPNEPTNDLLVASNSLWSSTKARASLVNIQSPTIISFPTNITVQDNVCYTPLSPGNAPSSAACEVYTRAAGDNAPTLSNNSSNAQMKNTDPLFAAPGTYAGMTLNPASYAFTGSTRSSRLGMFYDPASV